MIRRTSRKEENKKDKCWRRILGTGRRKIKTSSWWRIRRTSREWRIKRTSRWRQIRRKRRGRRIRRTSRGGE